MTRSKYCSGKSWPQIPIGKVISSTQYGLSTLADSFGMVSIVGMKDIHDGLVHIDPSVRITIPETRLSQYLLEDGDILLNRTNSPDLVGKSGLFRGNANAVFASYLVRIKLDRSQADPEFINQFMNSEMGQRQIKTLSTRAISQANLNPTAFRQHFHVPFPPITVQREIATILSTWDATIEKTKQLLTLREQQKKWLVNRTAKQSAPTFRLSDFLNPTVRTVPKPTQPYRALGIRSHGKGTFQRLVENPETVDMDQLFTVKRDDLIVNITFAWEGAIAIVKPEDESCLVSHRFPTYEFDRNIAIPEFVKFLINRKSFFSQLALISPGGAGRNRVLNKKDFLKLTLNLPDISQQRRVAEIFGTMNRLIEIETELLLKLKKQKRGLMQKLLTGQWRVKVADTEAA